MGKKVARKLSARDAAIVKALLARRSDTDRLLNRATHEERSAFNFSNSKEMLRTAIEERSAATRRTGMAQARSGRWARSEAELEREAQIRAQAPELLERRTVRWVARHFRVNRKALERIMGGPVRSGVQRS